MKKYKPETLGVMIDVSRNAVMSLDGLKRFLPLLKKCGYNSVMLYTEDTYEVEGEPYFGYMRGGYSVKEMKEIDAYAASLGLELIPCIQTLAHLKGILRWNKYPTEGHDVLLADDERTYELIDRMLATVSKCFSSRRIHIGMDEAHDLGRGEHLDLHGYEPVSEIMKRHLNRVDGIVSKYGLEPMMWSDMFFRPWNNGAYYAGRSEIPDEYVSALPKSVIPVYWDYYHTDKEDYDGMFYNHSQLSDKTWFAGGAWNWLGFAPFNKYTLASMLPAMDSCRENNVKNIFITLWGDGGAECSRLSVLPSLFYIAQYVKGNTDDGDIKRRFKRAFGIEFDDFMLLDIPNKVRGHELDERICTSKYMLYSDCLSGFLDVTVMRGGENAFKDHSTKLRRVARSNRRFGYLFDTLSKLCDALSVKYELGIKTYEAYKNGDRNELLRLAKEDYPKAGKLIDIFAKALEKQWMLENKAQGFEVQDTRLGGVIRRLDTCRRRILDYVGGRISEIEELTVERLPIIEDENKLNSHVYAASVNVFVE